MATSSRYHGLLDYLNGGISIFPAETDLEGTPPCEALCPSPEVCGKPSVSRMYGTCISCGNHGYLFVCGICLKDMRSGIAGCASCGNMATITMREA